MSDATPAPGDTNGGTEPAAAPAALGLPELSPREKRAARERARRVVEGAEKARLEKAAVAKAATAEKAAAAEPEYSDAQLREAASHFLRGVLLPLVSLLARPFGYTLDLSAYAEATARDDGAAWVPVLRLYGWLRAVVTWAAVPARLFARVRELAHRRDPKPEEVSK